MTTWVYVCLGVSAVLPWMTRWAARALHPATAVRALTVVALSGAVAWTAGLLMLALTLFDDLPPLSALDNRPDLGLPKPVPGWVALLAAFLLAAGAVRTAREWRRRRHLVAGLRQAGKPAHGMVVADWQEPVAIAVPGNPGHVLITSGMLRLLDGPECQAVFAHERAHLRHRHDRWITASALAAAAHPALSPLALHLSHLAERWADEDAAQATGDRRLVARAIAKAALATPPSFGPPVLGAHGTGAVARVTALHQPARRSQRRRIAGLGAACFFLGTAIVLAAVEFYNVAQAWVVTLLSSR